MILNDETLNMIIGAPRCGKTTFANMLVNDCLKSNQVVFSNVPFIGSRKIKNVEQIHNTDYRNCILIIDESGSIYNCHYSKKFTREMFEFYSCLGHRGVQAFFLVQNWDRLDISLRRLATGVTYIDKYGFLKKWFSHITYYRSMCIPSAEQIYDDGLTEMCGGFVDKFEKTGKGLFFRPFHYKGFNTHAMDKKLMYKPSEEIWE